MSVIRTGSRAVAGDATHATTRGGGAGHKGHGAFSWSRLVHGNESNEWVLSQLQYCMLLLSSSLYALVRV